MSDSRVMTLAELRVRVGRIEARIEDAKRLRESTIRNHPTSEASIYVVSYLDNRIAAEMEQLNRTNRAINEYELNQQLSTVGVVFIDGERVSQ